MSVYVFAVVTLSDVLNPAQNVVSRLHSSPYPSLRRDNDGPPGHTWQAIIERESVQVGLHRLIPALDVRHESRPEDRGVQFTV